MKRWMAALLALLMLLTGCTAAQEPEAVPTPTPQQELELADSALLKRRDVSTLLIGAVAYDEDGNSKMSSLNVLVRTEQGEYAILTIPKDTRVWVDQYDEQGAYQYCRYGAISEVYHAAESAGLGAQKMTEAVSSLLGGVQMDHYALLNVVQLEKLTELVGSVTVIVQEPVLEHGIAVGTQDIAPKISGYASYSYFDSLGGVDYPGTDPLKLQRHQELIAAFLELFAQEYAQLAQEEQADYAKEIIRCVTTDLDDEALQDWIGSAPKLTEAVILKGMQNEGRGESYWICDRNAVKEWVVEHFYIAEE